MGETVVIRLAQPDDTSALVRLKQQMTLHEHAQLPAGSPLSALFDLTLRAAEHGVSAYWQAVTDGGEYLVAELGGAIVGSTLWAPTRLSAIFGERGRIAAIIMAVVVDQAYRGRGIATQLMERAEAGMRGAGVQMAMLEATLGNAEANRLYKRIGFHGFETVMVKPLTLKREELGADV